MQIYRCLFTTAFTAMLSVNLMAAPVHAQSSVCKGSAATALCGSAEREIWFAPQGGKNLVADYMDLFKPDAPWKDAASHVQVFKMYSDFVLQATPDQMSVAVADLKRRGIALAIEAGVINGPNKPPPTCGGIGLEGYSSIERAERISRKIIAAGGTVKYLVMDEPFYYGHYYSFVKDKLHGLHGCQDEVGKIVGLLPPVLNVYLKAFPGLLIGDIEPSVLTQKSPQWQSDLSEWAKGFSATMKQPLAFMQLDVQWPQPNGKREKGVEDGLALYNYAQQLVDQGLVGKVGIVYNGSGQDTSDEGWVRNAKNHMLIMEEQNHLRPEQVLFQSWHTKPSHAMPDTASDTLTGLINFYFTPEIMAKTGRSTVDPSVKR